MTLVLMTVVLMTLAGAGLLGSFVVALQLDLAERGGRPNPRRLARPRASALRLEAERV